MYPNPLKQKLQNGELVLGTALSYPSAAAVTATCRTGIDFLWFDTEHAPYGTELLEVAPTLARQQGVAPLIRVAWNDPALIKKAYDVGAVAVMVPQVNTAEEAARAVQYARYPPLGQRGVSPNWPFIAGEDWGNVIRTANDETVLIVQIESVESYNNLDEIAAVPGIDVLFVGPMDLSASLGMITELGAKEVQSIMHDVVVRLRKKGIPVGTTLGDLADLQEKVRWGYQLLNAGSPFGYGVEVVRSHVSTLRATV